MVIRIPYTFGEFVLMLLVPDGIEHVIHFSYNNSSYGMRLSHMSYSSTGGKSHVILCDTEYAAAKLMIEQLKYGNQVCTTFQKTKPSLFFIYSCVLYRRR